MKVINDITGPNKLIPTLFIFRIYLYILILLLPLLLIEIYENVTYKIIININ